MAHAPSPEQPEKLPVGYAQANRDLLRVSILLVRFVLDTPSPQQLLRYRVQCRPVPSLLLPPRCLALRGRARHGCSENKDVRGGEGRRCSSDTAVSSAGIFPSSASPKTGQDAPHHEPASANGFSTRQEDTRSQHKHNTGPSQLGAQA